MRVNVYAEEMTERVEIISKEIDGQTFTGLRFYLELPVTLPNSSPPFQARGPFIHRPGDDDSAAVTFWGKRDLRTVLRKALAMLDAHYAPAPSTTTYLLNALELLTDALDPERDPSPFPTQDLLHTARTAIARFKNRQTDPDGLDSRGPGKTDAEERAVGVPNCAEQIAACLRSRADTILDNNMSCGSAHLYLQKYAATVLKASTDPRTAPQRTSVFDKPPTERPKPKGGD